METIGARFSNGLQWLDSKIGHQDNGPSNGYTLGGGFYLTLETATPIFWTINAGQDTLPPKSLAALDGEIVDPEIAVEFQMYLKYTVHKHNIYTIWYIKCNSVFYQIGMRKYPRRSFQWYCLFGGHMNQNKGQISIALVGP